MARAVLIVPPFIKYSAGPLLGPSLLKSAALKRGHQCAILDLNALFIRRQNPGRTVQRGMFVGDHDKPSNRSFDLSCLEQTFLCYTVLPCLGAGSNESTLRRVRFGFLQHEEVQYAAKNLAASSYGAWTRDMLVQKVVGEGLATPHLFGVSLLHAGQVIPAVAVSMIAKELWPETLVVWGGPHISGIGNAIREDVRLRRFAADIFVTGHAEQTFVEILDHLSSRQGEPRPSGLVKGLRGGSVMPRFENLELYDNPPVLPAQSTLGCAYGRCSFCTYPAIEPTPSKLDLCITVDSVVDQAMRVDGTIAIKDSLVTPLRLKQLGDLISDRVKWSACSKLNHKLDFKLLRCLATNGLATLEVGLESLVFDTQRRVAKVHAPHLYEEFLSSVARVTPEVSLVVNYMTGFPWEDPNMSRMKLLEAKHLLDSHLGSRGMFEHNCFELERLSPMAKEPERFAIDKSSLKFYPWASVVEYEPLCNTFIQS